MKKIILASLSLGALLSAGIALASIEPPSPDPNPLPIEIYECKQDGWTFYLDSEGYSLFKNQGDCVSFVATGGTNLPDGPTK